VHHHDRDRGSCFFRGLYEAIRSCHDDVDVQTQKLRNGRRQEFRLASCGRRFEGDVRTSDITKLPKAFLKSRGVRAWRRPKQANLVYLRRWLRLDGERRGEHGSQARDERAAPHSITGSARTSTDGGT